MTQNKIKHLKFGELKKLLPVVSNQEIQDEVVITILNMNLVFVLHFLKFHINCQYSLLSCISGVDLLGKDYRFLLAYDLLSLTYNTRLRVKVFIDETMFVPSSVNVFINANWWEKEIWDMFGIYFKDNSDLRRILTDYGFEGYPMRKDFPSSGFVEARYGETKKRVLLEPLELSQEFRQFTFEIPW